MEKESYGKKNTQILIVVITTTAETKIEMNFVPLTCIYSLSFYSRLVIVVCKYERE
jgi:hypothetical protein